MPATPPDRPGSACSGAVGDFSAAKRSVRFAGARHGDCVESHDCYWESVVARGNDGGWSNTPVSGYDAT